MKRDYYEVLGVERSASHEVLKKAYKRLAKELHPDRNPDDPSAEDRFKEASEAFQVLSDSDKRSVYDRYGHEGLDRSGYQGFHEVGDVFGSLGDIFGELFGGFGRRGDRSGAQRGADLKVMLRISLKEAAFGGKRELDISHPVPCETCQGTGGERSICQMCGGTGQVAHSRGMFVMSSTCPNCRGQGSTITVPCETCNGRGEVDSERKVTVTIPAGVDSGQTLRLTGQGQPGRRNGPSGHLYVVLEVEADERFQRDGYDLIYELPISFPEAALGSRLEVPVLKEDEDGVAQLMVPAGTQPGQTLVVRGAGIPRLDGRGRGDLIAVVQVHVPTKLNRKAKKLLEDLAQQL